MTIWKYHLPIRDIVKLSMPEGAQPLAVQSQYGVLTLWAMVDADLGPRERVFRVIGTGHPFNSEGLKYIGTAQVGLLVWHVFEALS